MKNYSTLLIALFFGFNLSAQAIYKTINSVKLQGDRKLKIQLPRNYNPDEKRSYPLIVVLDGDYLFEPVAGNIDYQSYWEDIPDCIVVGINQGSTREEDFLYDQETNFPVDSGAAFYEFISSELLPYIEDNYQVSSFRIIVGHDLSANFINYFLFKDEPLFRAYVALSPEFSPEMSNRLKQRMSILKKEIFYYMATADADVKALKASIKEADELISTIPDNKVIYKFDNFDDANHYSLVGRGIPKALNQIFGLFRPINAKEFKEKLLTYEGSPFDYLENKYENIEYFYGFGKKLIENDVRAIAAACNKRDDIESLGKLAKLVNDYFPKSMLSAYYLGMYYEKEGNLKKALLQYKGGLLLQPSQSIDKEVMLEKMYDTQEALND